MRDRRPTGVRRLLFRAPILLYRLRLGWLFGRRLVLLEHRGRTSGLLRSAVVEVVDRDRSTGAVTIASGFGTAPDWYRNLQHDPRAHMVVGSRRVAVHAVMLSEEEGAEAMSAYARRHPRAARMVARYVDQPVDGSDEAYRALGRRLPYVRLEPVDGSA